MIVVGVILGVVFYSLAVGRICESSQPLFHLRKGNARQSPRFPFLSSAEASGLSFPIDVV